MRPRTIAGLLAVLVMGLPFTAHASTTVVVDPSSSTWSASTQGAAVGRYIEGPSSPPLGSGAYEQIVTATADSATIGTAAHNGTPLASITKLSYSTFVERNAGGQASYIRLAVDTNGDGAPDDVLRFEPVYQNGTYPMVPGAGATPNQCPATPTTCATTGAWQKWDARSGGWWADSASTFGPPLDTLSHYASVHPGARLATTGTSLAVSAGNGWTGYQGAFDAITVGVSGSDTTYDFEAGAPTVVVVYPFDLHQWVQTPTGTGTGSFVFGPGTPPGGGLGSYRQSTPATDDRHFVESPILSGRALSDIHSLSYSTYVTAHAPDAPVMQLDVWDDSGAHTMKFEPYLQNGSLPMTPGAGPVPNQCVSVPGCVANGQWQTWDADAGAWWVSSVSGPYDTLAHYAATHPNAHVAPGNSLRIAAGSTGSSWNGYSGSFDRVRVDSTIYDFEPMATTIDCNTVTDDLGAIQAAVNGAPNGTTIKLSGVCDFTQAPAHGGDITSIANAAVLIRPPSAGSPVNGLRITSDGAPQSATILGNGTQAAFVVGPGNDNVTIDGLTFVNVARATVAVATHNTTIGFAGGATPDPRGNRIIASATADSLIDALSISTNPASSPSGTVVINYGTAATPATFTNVGSSAMQGYTVAGNYITYAPNGPGLPDVVGIDVRERFGHVANGVTIANNAVGFESPAFPSFNINAIKLHSLSPATAPPTNSANDYFIRNVTISGNNLGRLEEIGPAADINAAGRAGIVLEGVGGFDVVGNGVRVFESPTGVAMPGGGIVASDSGYGKIRGNGVVVLADPSTLKSDLGAIGVVDDLNVAFGEAPKPQKTTSIEVTGNLIGTVDPNTDGISQRGLVVDGASLITAKGNTFELGTAPSINIAAVVEGPGNPSNVGPFDVPPAVTGSAFCGNDLHGVTDDPNNVSFGDGGVAGSSANSFPGGAAFAGNGGCVAAAVSVVQSGGTTNVAEGGAIDTYTLALSYRPSANVTITLNPGTQLGVLPASVTFTPLNWNVPQTITVSAVDDSLVEGGHFGTITHTASSADPSYSGIGIANVVAIITDNDLGQVGVTPTALTLSEGGAAGTYQVVLTGAPPVNVTVAPHGTSRMSISPSSLTFTPLNWSVPQTVTVQIPNDAIRQNTEIKQISHSVASTNASWNGIAAPGVVVTMLDNDPPAPPVVSSPAVGGHTCSTSVILSGTGESGATIEAYEGMTLLTSTTASIPGGSWITSPVTLAGGSHTIGVRQIGTDSLASAQTLRTFLVDLVAPAAPAITSPAAGATLTSRPVTVSGTGEPGTTVFVRIGGSSIAAANVRPDGTWSVAIPFGSGSHTITAVDSDGCQTSGDSAPVGFDVQLPQTPVILTPVQHALTQSIVTVSGTAADGTKVRLLEGVSTIADNIPVAGGTWSVDVTFAGGVHSITAKAFTTTAVGDPSAARTFTVDDQAPKISINRPGGYLIALVYTPIDGFTVKGTASDDNGVASVELTYTNLVTGDVTTTLGASCAGCGTPKATWEDSPALLPGLYSIDAVSVDLAGNRSAIVSDLLVKLTV